MKKLLPFLLLSLFTTVLLGQGEPQLLKDMKTSFSLEVLNFPAPMGVLGDKAILTAGQSQTFGQELWVTDGTDEGTRLLVDINLGQTSSTPWNWIKWNDKIYFAADDGVHGNELWVTDGTLLGTYMIKDIRVGSKGANISQPVLCHDKLYFAATGTNGDRELYVSDGTTAGTGMLMNIWVGGPSNPDMLKASGTNLFFIADDGVHGKEPWVSDGTLAGTQMVKDVISGSGSSVPVTNIFQYREEPTFEQADGGAFFTADDDIHGPSVWYTNGTPGHAVRLSSAGRFHDLSNINGKLFFGASDPVTAGQERLWVSDGTPGNTQTIGAATVPRNFAPFGNKLIFTDNTTLWVSDGTSGGTQKLQNNYGNDVSGINFIVALDDIVVATSNGSSSIYRTDGTQANTVEVELGLDIQFFWWPITPFIKHQNRYLFYNNGHMYSASLQFDSLRQFENFQQSVNGVFPRLATPVGDKVYFGSVADGVKYGIWTADPSGVHLVDKLTNSHGLGDLNEIGVLDDAAIINAVSTSTGRGLYRSVGGGPLEKILDFVTWPPPYPRYFTPFDGNIYFVTRPSTIWRTDGTMQGTEEVDQGFTDIGKPLAALGNLYYPASKTGGQLNLWRSTSSANSAQRVAQINPTGKTYIQDLTEFDNHIYFAASGNGNNVELWRSDGISEAEMVKDLRPGPAGSYPRRLTVVGDKLFFRAQHSSLGEELWVCDGTADGTYLLKDIKPGHKWSNIRSMREFKGKLYFIADDGTHGRELWVSDGTIAGTQLLVDINPGHVPSIATKAPSLVDIGDRLYFAAFEEQHGMELWSTDGTEAGTELVYDLVPGQEGSYPLNLAAAAGKLFFSAFAPATGREPYMFEPSGSVSLQHAAFTQEVNMYPNPASSQVSLEYTLEKATAISITLHDFQGKLVAEYAPETLQTAGPRKDQLALPDYLPAGVYFLTLTVDQQRIMKKLMIDQG